MENKYYSPKIEDLHIGLECEILKYSDSDEEFFENHILDNIILKNLLELSILHKDIDNWLKRTIRIKFLDKEDIESFEFTFDNKDKDLYSMKKEIKYQGFGNVSFKINFNQKREKNISVFFTTDNSIDNKFIFFGKIKNKSELKKILVQLGIFDLQTY